MLQVYSQVTSPERRGRDGANQPRQPRRHWDQGIAERGPRPAPNTDARHPADSLARWENRHQVWEIPGPADQTARIGRAQSPPHPKYWSWRRLELPAETPVRKAVTNSQASCQVHRRCNRIWPIHPIQLHALPKGDQTSVYWHRHKGPLRSLR